MGTIIVYATKHGTVEKAIGLLKEKMSVEIETYHVGKDQVPSLESYDTVIIGGSIYVGKVQNELVQFINENLDELLTKKVGLFLCAGHPDAEQLNKEMHDSFPEVLYNHAYAKEVFGYGFDFEKMNFLERLIIKKIQGVKESQYALSDEKISNFADAMM